jgi:hypothetical protein
MQHMCVFQAQESIVSRMHEVDWQPHDMMFFTVSIFLGIWWRGRGGGWSRGAATGGVRLAI